MTQTGHRCLDFAVMHNIISGRWLGNAVSKLLCDVLRIETTPNTAGSLSAAKEDRRSGQVMEFVADLLAADFP